MAASFLWTPNATYGAEHFFQTALGAGDAVSFDAGTGLFGGYGYKSTVNATNGFAHIDTFDNVVSNAGWRISFWFRFDRIPTAPTVICSISGAGASGGVIGVAVTTGPNIEVKGSGTARVGTTILIPNTWYRCAWTGFLTSSTVYTSKVYIDGVLEATTTNDGAMANNVCSTIEFGVDNGTGFLGSGSLLAVTYDGLYVDTVQNLGDPGPIYVTARRPNANGALNQWTTQVGAGGSGYGTGHSPQVNERPASQTNAWSITPSGSALTEEYNLEPVHAGDRDLWGAEIVDVMYWVYAKAAASVTGQIVGNGAASNIALTTTATMFTKLRGETAYPLGTGADIGIKSDTAANLHTLYECGALVSYLLRAKTYRRPPTPSFQQRMT